MLYSEYPKTRAEAKLQGTKYYFTGDPCRRGHIALRKAKGCCVECMKEDWVIDNERRKSKPKSEAAKSAGKRYYERNKEAVIARANARPLIDKQRYKKAHKAANPEYYNVLNSLRKRRHKNATPIWLTKQQKNDIKELYINAMELTRITKTKYVVDHVIPLNNPTVCGLHVPWNLRVITQEENLKKSNSFES